MEKVESYIQSDWIRLDQFLKWVNQVSSGGEGKTFIEAGKVLVNEEIELRRGRKLKPGDQVLVNNVLYLVSVKK